MKNQTNVSFIGTGTMNCPIMFKLLDKGNWIRLDERRRKATKPAIATGIGRVIEKV